MMCWLWSAASTSFATCVRAFSKFSGNEKRDSTGIPLVIFFIILKIPLAIERLLSSVRALVWALTSQVPVEVLQPADLGHQPLPEGLLQGLPLAAALDQGLVGLRYTLDLLLQLEGDMRKNEGYIIYGSGG